MHTPHRSGEEVSDPKMLSPHNNEMSERLTDISSGDADNIRHARHPSGSLTVPSICSHARSNVARTSDNAILNLNNPKDNTSVVLHFTE
jgi:hypothetical protein